MPASTGTGDMTKAAYDADSNNVVDTATALAANPTDCGANAVATAIAANGDLTCSYSIGTNIQAYDADLTTYAGITPSANVQTFLGSADYAAMRTNLSLVPGTNVQTQDALLTSLAGLTTTAGDIIYFTASDTAAILDAGTQYQILQMGASAPGWVSSLAVESLNLASATSSVPMPVNTTTTELTTAGSMHYESDADILSIGDGTTDIDLTFTPATAIVFPSASGTLATLAGTESLTNKTITTPNITSLEVLIDCNGSADPYAYCTSANASTLTATQTGRTIINSYGRGEAQTVTLPAAATGMTFIAMVGTQHNSAWKIQRAGSDTITWSSGGTDTAGKTYFQETNQAVGARVSCITYKSAAAAWSWLCGSVTGTWVTD
jgi:hypothetical protein